MDLAMRVVERYFGREVAERNAYYMEYQGERLEGSTGAANAAYLNVKTEARIRRGSGVRHGSEARRVEGGLQGTLRIISAWRAAASDS